MPHKLGEMKAVSSSVTYRGKDRSKPFHSLLQMSIIFNRLLINSYRMLLLLLQWQWSGLPFALKILEWSISPSLLHGVLRGAAHISFVEDEKHFAMFHKALQKHGQYWLSQEIPVLPGITGNSQADCPRLSHAMPASEDRLQSPVWRDAMARPEPKNPGCFLPQTEVKTLFCVLTEKINEKIHSTLPILLN